jgi:hypothetical protein
MTPWASSECSRRRWLGSKSSSDPTCRGASSRQVRESQPNVRSSPYGPRPGKASLAAAFGNYKGQSNLAVGFGYGVTARFRLNGAFPGAPQVNDYGAVVGAPWTLN